MGNVQPDLAYIAGLVRHRMAAGALFRDEAGNVMVVHTTYKDRPDIPGGMVDEGESPRAACVREVEEELGIKPQVGSLLCVDWVAPRPPWDSGLMFVFDGGMLTASEIAGIRLCPEELDRFEFLAVDALDGAVKPSMARRLKAGEAARRAGRTAYLENGRDVDQAAR